MTANTEPAIKRGHQWWSFLDIEREGSFFFLFFCNIQSLTTIVENDEKIFNKVVSGMRNIFKKRQ